MGRDSLAVDRIWEVTAYLNIKCTRIFTGGNRSDTTSGSSTHLVIDDGTGTLCVQEQPVKCNTGKHRVY